MLKRVVPMLMAGYALWRWGGWQQRRLAQQQRQASRAKPPELTTWEGEGGALPGTGSQIGPDPAARR